jgi:hypothetical protein
MTPLDMTAFVILEQLAKANVPMLVTLPGMVMLVIVDLLAKALLAIATTGKLLVVAGILTAPPEPV